MTDQNKVAHETNSEIEKRFNNWIDAEKKNGHIDMKLYTIPSGASTETVDECMREIMMLVNAAKKGLVAEYPSDWN